MSKKKARTKAMKDHLTAVMDLGPHPEIELYPGRGTIHHCHSGSISDRGIRRGWSQRPSDWLAVYLPESIHTGNNGIDSGYGVRSWERDLITQEELLIWTGEQLGVDLFEQEKNERSDKIS